MRITNIYFLFLLILSIPYKTLAQDEEFSFDSFLAELVKEIDQQIQTEEAEIDAPLIPEKEKPSQEIIIERSKDLKTDFLNEFPPAPKPGEKAIESDKKPELPRFKSDAAEYYLSLLSASLSNISKKTAGLDQAKIKKFGTFKKNIASIIEKLDKIESNRIYHPILFEKTFNNFRKKILSSAEKLKKLDSELELALAKAPKDLKIFSGSQASTESPLKPLKEAHKKAVAKNTITKEQEMAYSALGLESTATDYEVLGVKENATISQIREAYNKLMNKWNAPKEEELKKISKSVKNIINKAYENIILGEEAIMTTSAGTRIALDKIYDFFLKELPPLSTELQKVIEKASKSVSVAKQEQEKLTKAAQARLAKLERTRPAAPASFGREYGGEEYFPESRGRGGRGDYQGGGYTYEAPSFEGVPYESYGEPSYGEYEGFGTGGGFGGGSTSSGFGKGGRGEKEKEEIAKGEPKKEQPSKAPEKLEGDEARESNIKNSVVDLSKKLQSESDKEKINELLDDIDANISTLSSLQIGLDPKRKKNSKWKNLNDKYKDAIKKYEPFAKKRAAGAKPESPTRKPDIIVTPPPAIEATEEKERNIKEAVIEMVKKLNYAVKKDEIEELISEIGEHNDILKRIQIGLDPMRKAKKDWIRLDKDYKANLETFKRLKKEHTPKEEESIDEEAITRSPGFQLLNQIEQFSNNLQNKFNLAQSNSNSVESFLFEAEKKLGISSKKSEFDGIISVMNDLEVNLRQLNSEFDEIQKNGTALLRQLQDLIQRNPALKTNAAKIAEIEFRFKSIINSSRQMLTKLLTYDAKRKTILENALKNRPV